MRIPRSNIQTVIRMVGIGLVFLVCYLLYLRPLVIDVYQGKSVGIWDGLIQRFYPRFEVERLRLPLEFFLAKCDQMVLRILSVGSLAIVFYPALEKHLLHQPPNTLSEVRIMKMVVVGFSAFYIYDNWQTLLALGQFPSFYTPTGWLAIIFPNYPSKPWIYALQIMLWISWLWALATPKPAIPLVIFLLDFVVIQAFFISFQKIDHGFATYFIALGGITGVYLIQNKTIESNSTWPLALARFGICLVYAMAGFEKLTISGMNWFQSTTIQHHLLVHQQPLGVYLAGFPWICTLISIGAIVFQIGFLVVFFLPKYTLCGVVLGIFFHGISGLLFQVAGFFSPWVLSYVIFIPWERWRIFSIQKLFTKR